MKKALYCTKNKLYHYKDGEKVLGAHDRMWGIVSDIHGDATGIRGNVSGLRGDVSYISGYVSGFYGNASGIKGDVSGIEGNLDECDITDEERKNGVLITELIRD
jgi:hypothetical protein